MVFKKQTTVKVSIFLLISMTIFLVMPVVALASTPAQLTPTGSGAKILVADILSDVQNAQSSDSVDSLTTSAKTAGNSVVTFLRVVAIIAAVIALIFIAYGLFFSPNVKTLVDMKGRLGALVVAIIIAFMAEKIVGTLFMWLGIKVGGS